MPSSDVHTDAHTQRLLVLAHAGMHKQEHKHNHKHKRNSACMQALTHVHEPFQMTPHTGCGKCLSA